MKKSSFYLACGICALTFYSAGSAQASTTYNLSDATTAASPTTHIAANGSPPTALQTAGGEPYATFAFGVSASGTYDFLSTAGYDNYTALYLGSFVPSSPLTNVLIANDDGGFVPSPPQPNDAQTTNHSGFSYQLNAGSTYVFVNASFQPAVSGPFTSTITGPGTVLPVSAVPEPSSIALMLAGLGLMGTVIRRRVPAAKRPRTITLA